MTNDMNTPAPSLVDQAMAVMDKVESPAPANDQPQTQSQSVELQQRHQVDTPQTVESPEQPVEPIALADDAMVRVKIDGKEQVVKYSDFKNSLSREAVFTQRQQGLAQQRRQLEDYFAQQQAQIIEQARAVQLAQEQLKQYNPLQELLQRQQQPQPKNPNEIATLGEIQQAIQHIGQQVQQARQADQQQLAQQLQQERAQLMQELEIKRDQEYFTNELSKIMDTDDGKLLSDVSPQAEAIIRYQTLQLGPENTKQAIEFMKEFTREWAQKVKGRVQTSTVQQEVKKAKVVMEPSTGTPAQTIIQQKPSFMKKDGSGIDYTALTQRALSVLDN